MTKGEDRAEKRNDSTQDGMTTDTFSPIILKDCAPIVIPPQLANLPGARFIRLTTTAKERKKPLDSKWTTESNYPATHAAIKGWLRGGNDYGVATGFGDLHCFDADDPARLAELGVLERLPKTFTIATGKGQHWWYIVRGMKKKILMHDPTERLHLGEVLSQGQFAVGPGSMHRSGKRYQVIDDAPVTELSEKDLIEILTGCGVVFRKKEPKVREATLGDLAKRDHGDDVDLAQICKPDHGQREGNEIVGEHPLHGATHAEDRGTSRNFSINPSRGVWCCRAHNDSGGGWREWIALEIGILRCEEAGSRKLTKDEYRQIYREAERRGLIASRTHSTISQEKRTIVDKLPTTLPEGKAELWIASPRTGKTHDAAALLVKTGEGNYYAPNHEIVRHALSNAVKMGARLCVHVEGKRQPGICRMQGEDYLQCNHCIMKPIQTREKDDIGETWSGLKKKTRELMKEKNILTKENVPNTMCPYFTLQFAEEFAKFKFTVINNINSNGIGEARDRALTVIDEDTCMAFFYPQTIEIATVTMEHGKAHIKTALDSNDIKTRVAEILGQKKTRLTQYALKITELQNTIADLDGEKITISEIASRIDAILKDWIPTHANVDDEEYGDNDNIKFGDVVKCMMYPYMDQRVSVKTRGFKSKIYMMADERKPTMNMKWWEKAEKVVIIGAARAELFINTMGGEIKEIEKFGFEDNFTVIVVGEEGEQDGRGKKGRLKRKLVEVAKLLSGGSEGEIMVPMMVLTGSEDEQDVMMKAIGNGTFKCVSEGEHALKRIHVSGLVAVFYAGSKISRGLDVDQFNVMIAVGTDFAQPFYSVVDQYTERRITIDEITNSLLRISPTRKQGDDRAKVIVIPEGEEWKVKYLQARMIKTTTSAKGIVRTLRKLGIAGESRIAGTELKITKHGTTKDKAYEKIFSAMMTVDDEVDEETIDTNVKMILNLLRDAPKRWIDTTEIKDKMREKMNVISKAVTAIAFGKMADTTISKGIVKLKHKKAPKNDGN